MVKRSRNLIFIVSLLIFYENLKIQKLIFNIIIQYYFGMYLSFSSVIWIHDYLTCPGLKYDSTKSGLMNFGDPFNFQN